MNLIEPKDQAMAAVHRLASPLLAIEAQWDGDSTGWFVLLGAVVRSPTSSEYSTQWLTEFRDPAGDIRLFNGTAPPWPEATAAKEVGTELADTLGIPFYFPSPDYPEDQCPHWWELDRSTPCRLCGVPLLQFDRTPWKGLCYRCHRSEDKKNSPA